MKKMASGSLGEARGISSLLLFLVYENKKKKPGVMKMTGFLDKLTTSYEVVFLF